MSIYGKYFGKQIIAGGLEYGYVVQCRPDLKEVVDGYLISMDCEEFIK